PLVDFTGSAFDVPLQTLVQPANGLSYTAAGAFQPVAAVLADGRVLTVSGNTAELFDPANGTFTATGSTDNSYNFGAAATALDDGTVLLTGGTTAAGFSAKSAELYHPDTASFERLPALMTSSHVEGTATKLTCPASVPGCGWQGKVLLAGGYDFDDTTFDATTALELYDPASKTFTSIGSIVGARYLHSATQLRCPPSLPACVWDSSVLLTGGYLWFGTGPSAEIVNLASGVSTPTAGSMVRARSYHTATPLTDGRVLVAGGLDLNALGISALSLTELFDPQTGRFEAGGSMLAPRWRQSASALPDGSVLLAGGRAEGGQPTAASMERYLPGIGFAGAGSLLVTREAHAAATLPDGRIAVLGGFSNSALSTRSAEVVAPADTPSILNPVLPAAAVGVAYDALLGPTGGSGAPYTLSLATSAQTLPPGLAFSTFTCAEDCIVALSRGTPPRQVALTPPIQLARISGTPTAAGTFSFGVRVTDRTNHAGEQTLSLRVNPLDITTAVDLARPVLGVPFSTRLAATGSGPLTWSMLPGSFLPAGLTLASDGTLSGVATTTGFFNLVARVIDSFGQIATRQFFFSVNTWFDQVHGGDGVSTNTLAVSVNSRVAQTVSTGVTGYLGGVMFGTLACSVNPVVVTIQGVSPTTGAPDDSRILATATATITRTFETIPLPTPLFLAADAKFAIVLSSPAGSCEVTNSSVGSDLTNYQDGAAFADSGSGWTRLSDTPSQIADLQFWTVASNASLLHTSYLGHTSGVRLQNGKVLFVGGNGTAELFDPETNTSSTRQMQAPRSFAAVTLLESGKVLVTGGVQFTATLPWIYHATAELYDPDLDAFVPVGASMADARYFHQATRLRDGRVLITGGQGVPDNPSITT